MFENNQFLNSIGQSFSILFFFGIFIGICLAAASLIVVPITLLWSICTGQSYSTVCDSSDILYKLNKIGKWTFAVIVGLYLLTLLF